MYNVPRFVEFFQCLNTVIEEVGLNQGQYPADESRRLMHVADPLNAAAAAAAIHAQNM